MRPSSVLTVFVTVWYLSNRFANMDGLREILMKATDIIGENIIERKGSRLNPLD
jgi:hypothetical protein